MSGPDGEEKDLEKTETAAEEKAVEPESEKNESGESSESKSETEPTVAESKEEASKSEDAKPEDVKSEDAKSEDAKEELKAEADKDSSEKKDDAEAESDKSDAEKKGEAENKDESTSASTDAGPDNAKASTITLTQHHVSHLLKDVLQDSAEEAPAAPKGMRFPMVLDLLLALGLLVAVGGFTVGLFHMYLVHSASQSISEQRYKAAIAILKGAPLPQVFARPGSDTEELLSKARYMDAMDKLEQGTDLEEAIKELGEIHAGSKYFALAQEAINENTEPAEVMLQGGAEHTDTSAPDNAEEKQSLLEKTLREDEQEQRR